MRPARVRTVAAGAVAIALATSGLTAVPAVADEVTELGGLLDLTRPELAAVAAELAAGDAESAAVELQRFYSGRTGVDVPVPGESRAHDATADELVAGVFRFGDQTRDFYDEVEQRIDVDWQDTWGGTETTPGGAQVLMSDFVFMSTLTNAYLDTQDPERRAGYAAAWMDISLDFFADNPDWPTLRNLSGAKRLAQLTGAFAVFRSEPTIDADRLVTYLLSVHATIDHLAVALPNHGGNNWYLSMARAIYVASVYLPEFSDSFVWEPASLRATEWFLGAYMKSDGVYREPTVNYQAYVADLLNAIIGVAELNDRVLPEEIPQAADWIADSLFATRMPNLEPALIGDAPNVDAGIGAIRTTAERNSWSDFAWVASDRTTGTTPTLGSTIYPISYAVQRSGWDADALYMMINNQNTSYTASHRHPDDLSVVMAAYGRPLIVDPGAGDYSATPTNDWMRYTTEAHNTIEVDGLPQEPGVTRASWLWRSNAGLDVYRGEAHGYRPVIHDRVVYFVKPGFWIVSDDLAGDTASHDYRQLWHFPGDDVSVDPTTGVATVGFGTTGGERVSGVQLVPVGTQGTDVAATVHDDGAVRVGHEVLTGVEFLSYDWTATGETGLDTVVFPGEAGAAPSVTASRIEMSGVDHSVATALEIDLPDATGRFYLSREDLPASRIFGSASTDGETAYIERDHDGRLTRYALTAGSSLVDDEVGLVEASDVVSDLDVQLNGRTAVVSLGDPFTGALTISAPDVELVLVNGSPAAFARDGHAVTVTVGTEPDLTPVLAETFDDAGLDRTVYAFDEGSLAGWTGVEGTWALGGPTGTGLEQGSTADAQAFAVQQDAPDDVVVTAQIVPGTRTQTTVRTGLAFRYQDSRNYYRANVLNTATGALLQIVRVYKGEATVLAETPLQLNADAAHEMTVSAVGSHLAATVGGTTISADDTRLPTGAVAAYTHRRGATFDDITIVEALDQDHWQGVGGDVSVSGGQLHVTPTASRAHVLVSSTLPVRFSETCDYDVAATVTLGGVGQVGLSLRDSTDSYGYRIHLGKTSRGSTYASIIREAHRSGPVTLASVTLSNRLNGPVGLGATIVGDRITVTLDGTEIMQARDTLIRSGGVGVYSTAASTFDDLTVARACGEGPTSTAPAPQDWDAATAYADGDLVSHSGSVWLATWWTENQEPGDVNGPWQEITPAVDGTLLWAPSTIFTAGEVTEHDGVRYRAQWWTRNQPPGAAYGPWELVE